MENKEKAKVFVASSALDWKSVACTSPEGVKLLDLLHGYEARFPRSHKVKADLIFPEKDAFSFGQGTLLHKRNYEKIARECDLVIAASTPLAEKFVFDLKGSGVIVARYSQFFNGRSKYTGLSAANGGYSLDIPKDPRYVQALLRNRKALDALVSRDAKRIRHDLYLFEDELEWPILTTPYLKEALRKEK